MSVPPEQTGDSNFSDFDNSDEDIASLLADGDDDDIFASKAFGDSSSKKTPSGSKTGPVSSPQKSGNSSKPDYKINQNVSNKPSPKRILSKNSSNISDDGADDVLNEFLAESSLPSFLTGSKITSPTNRGAKKTTKDSPDKSKFLDDLGLGDTKAQKDTVHKNLKKTSESDDEDDDILKSIESNGKASGTPRKQRSGSFFDDFLKNLSPKNSPKKSLSETIDNTAGDDSEDEDLLKSLESDVQGPESPRKRSGSFFDDFLKNVSPKQTPKKSAVTGAKVDKVEDKKNNDSGGEEEEDVFGKFALSSKKSYPPTQRNPPLEKRRESLLKQVSFKGIPETVSEEPSKESPIKESQFSTKMSPEKSASDLKPKKSTSQPKRSERMGAANKDDTDWLNFFKESPKKSSKSQESPVKPKESTEIQPPSKDFAFSASRRRSSSAEWLGLSEAKSVPKTDLQIPKESKVPVETEDSWLEKNDPISASRPRTTPGRIRQGDDSQASDLSWLGNDKKTSVEKGRNLPKSSPILGDSVPLSEASTPGMNTKTTINEPETFQQIIAPQESRTATARLQFEKNEDSLQSISPNRNRNKFTAATSEVVSKPSEDNYAHGDVVKDSSLRQEPLITTGGSSYALQSVVNNLTFERDQLSKSLESMKQMYEEKIRMIETLRSDQLKASEESFKAMETKLKLETEDKVRALEEKINAIQHEKKVLENDFKSKQDRIEKENVKEIQRLKELHNESIDMMKQDHEEAILRLKRLKEQEIEAVLSTQIHSRSLQHLTEQLEARTTELASLQVKVEERNQATMREKQSLLDAKERDLKSLQTRLQRQLENSDDERDRLQQLVLRLESRLQKYATEGEEDRWEVQQMKARLSVQQKHLDEEYKLQMQQAEREKEKLRLSQDSLLYEQKTVLVQLAQERQQLMHEKVDLESLTKRIKEDEAKLHVKILKEESFIEKQKQFIQQEQSRLQFEKSNVKQEVDFLERERDALQTEKQMLKDERTKVNELNFKLKRKEHELEMMAMSAAEEKERGQAEHAAALKIKADQQSRVQEITKKLQDLMEKEHQILSEKEKLTEERIELENKKNSMLCNKCKLSLGHPVNAPPIVPSVSNINTTPVVASPFLNGISNPLVPPNVDPSLIVWYITAQKDREFLQEELSFLRSLKESSKNYKK